MATFPFTGDPLSLIEMIYIGYFGRAGDPVGTSFWVTADLSGTPLNTIAGLFSTAAEAKNEYTFLNNPQSSSTTGPGNALDAFINQIYQNLFGRDADGTDTTGGLGFWRGQILPKINNPAALQAELGVFILQVALGAQPADAAVLQAKVTVADFLTQQFTQHGINFGDDGSPADNFAHTLIAGVHGPGNVPSAESDALDFALNPPTIETFTLTVGQDFFVGNGGDIVTGPLAGVFGDQPTLTDFDHLVTDPTGLFQNQLNAFFDGSASARGVDIVGFEQWNIANHGHGTVRITGGAPGTNQVISDLHQLNFNAESGTSSLFIGDNTEPVQVGDTPFDGFSINVSNAVGKGYHGNGVNVDLEANGFTGHDTINVSANVVGAWPLDSGGSLLIPDPIVINCDDYNPNWDDFADNAYAIAAGASSGPRVNGKNPTTGATVDPVTGAVGFATWNVSSLGAINVQPPIAFANWVMPTGVNIIALGAEGSESATALNLSDDGSSTMLFSTKDNVGDSGGAHDWMNLAHINLAGTSGFVVLTGLEASNAIYSGANTDGLLSDNTTALKDITGGAGNSFYDLSSLNNATAKAAIIDGGHSVLGNSEVVFNNSVLTGSGLAHLNHIQVLDDADSAMGGTIDMANFLSLQPLNVDYTLIGGGTVPHGYQLLQLLNPDGSTDVPLTKDLIIANGPTKFAVNMQDMSDGKLIDDNEQSTGYNITIYGQSPGALVDTNNNLIVFVSDGLSPPGEQRYEQGSSSFVSAESGYESVYNVPVFTVDNYTKVDIWIPFEGHDVGLGTKAFIDQPVVTVAGATVTFHDNTADTGGYSGAPDDLYVGHTQTYDAGTGLQSYFDAGAPSLIGDATVIIDTTGILPGQTSTITDLGAGRFEIGATNVNTLDAHTTSHLVMDIAATGNSQSGSGENLVLDHGITVLGGTDHNLIQGSSGPIHLDNAAIFFPNDFDEDDDITTNDAYYGATANDTLTGGSHGDNFFGAGGNDVINLGGHNVGNNVWIGAYDIGYSGSQETGTDPGLILEQAITDTDSSGYAHNFVNGYGDHVTQVNGFDFGASGDTITFMLSDWANAGTDGAVQGLTNWDGHTSVDTSSTVFQIVSQAGAFAGNIGDPTPDIVLDNISAYANAAALQAALTNPNVGDIHLNSLFTGVVQGTVSDLLIAYQKSDLSGITIADVTIDATNASQNITETDELHGGSLQVHDLVTINIAGLNLGNFDPHNVQFHT